MTDARPNIWRLQAQSDVDGLIKALENGDPDIRLRAAIALRALSATEAISPLRSRLAVEDDAEVRTNLTQVLVFLLEEHEERSEQQKSAPLDETALLVSQLKSKDVEDIIHAAQALGALGDPMAVEPLIVLFNNLALPPGVRLAAAEALIELKSPPTSVTALVALRRPDWHIRRIAAAMLGHLEADWAVEPLRKTLADENELVRRTARAALKHIGTPEALKAAESVPEEQPAAEPSSASLVAVAPASKAGEQPPAGTAAPPVRETAPAEMPVPSTPESEKPAPAQPTGTSQETTTSASGEAAPDEQSSEAVPTAVKSSEPEIAASKTAQPDIEPEKKDAQPVVPDSPSVQEVTTPRQSAPPALTPEATTSVPVSPESKAKKSEARTSNDGASSEVESARHSPSQN